MAKIEVENVNAPDNKVNLNAEKYGAMFDAMMAVISSEPMTYAAIKEGVLPILSQEHFPKEKHQAGGSKRCSLIWKPRVWWCDTNRNL